MLIESAMPTCDAAITEHVVVAAEPAATFAAVRSMDLLTVRTPLLNLSMWLRGLPARLSGGITPPLVLSCNGHRQMRRRHHRRTH